MSELEASYREFRRRGGAIDLSARTKLRLSGADRVRYLNGQVTANVNRATAGKALPACVTTAKGKLCADVFIAVDGESLIVDADESLREALAARLEKYIVADEVTLEDATDDRGLVHFLGMEPMIPEGGLRLECSRFGQAGVDWHAPRELIEQVRNGSADDFPWIAGDLLEVIHVEAGIPKWGAELDTNTFPSEAGLDRTHVDFHKGCYIGQEVISRIESVGHANRALHGFTSPSGAPLAAGARIFTADAPERDLGVLTSAVYSFALEAPIALGYLKRNAPVEGLLAAPADAPDAPVPIVLHSLPFVS